MVELGAEKIAQAVLHVIGARRGADRTAAASRPPTAHCRASCGKSRPARCSFASASPTPAQWATFGLRGHTPSRKLMIAAGRPASVPSASPLRFLTGCGQMMPCVGKMRHQAEKERQIVDRHALFIQRQDETIRTWCAAGSWNSRRLRRCPCRTAVRRCRSRQKVRKLVGGDVGIDRHALVTAASGRSERGSGKNSFSSAADTVST